MTDKKDLVAISEFEKKYIDDFDFSGTMAKFKVIKTIKGAGRWKVEKWGKKKKTEDTGKKLKKGKFKKKKKANRILSR
jgi:hypothetical protein